MGKSKRDILDTERMLERLTGLLSKYHKDALPVASPIMFSDVRPDAESLRRISMTLHRWHEMECNGDVTVSEDGTAYAQYGRGTAGPFLTSKIPNREAGANKRLKAIMARYPSLTAYVQGDPRGCALYILKPGDVPADGGRADEYYSRGLAVFR